MDQAALRHPGIFIFWARQTLEIPGVYATHSPELEDPVPDSVVVKRI